MKIENPQSWFGRYYSEEWPWRHTSSRFERKEDAEKWLEVGIEGKTIKKKGVYPSERGPEITAGMIDGTEADPSLWSRRVP